MIRRKKKIEPPNSDSGEKQEIQNVVLQTPDAVAINDPHNLIARFMNPSHRCPCCNIPKLSKEINRDYLSGSSYDEISKKYSDEVYQAVGKKLTTNTLRHHFTKHFNVEGAAVAEYNRGMKNLPVAEREEMKEIFDVLKYDKVNDIEMLDLTRKKQVKLLSELEDIKAERIAEGRSYNIDNLIMKQSQIISDMNNHITEKLKIWQKAQFQSKQIEVMDRSLEFLDSKTAEFLGVNMQSLAKNPAMAKQAEEAYLKVVVNLLLKKVRETIDTVLTLDAKTKAELYKEMARKFQGVEEEINREFQEKVREIKEVKKR